jgi:hypothetical protein
LSEELDQPEKLSDAQEGAQKLYLKVQGYSDKLPELWTRLYQNVSKLNQQSQSVIEFNAYKLLCDIYELQPLASTLAWHINEFDTLLQSL